MTFSDAQARRQPLNPPTCEASSPKPDVKASSGRAPNVGEFRFGVRPACRPAIERDVEVSGAPNPMLARHGAVSEARQYSGRAVGSDWSCPFAAKPEVDPHDF